MEDKSVYQNIRRCTTTAHQYENTEDNNHSNKCTQQIMDFDFFNCRTNERTSELCLNLFFVLLIPVLPSVSNIANHQTDFVFN